MCVLLSLEPRDSHRLALRNKNKGREAETRRMASSLGRDGIQTKVALFKLGVPLKQKEEKKRNENSAEGCSQITSTYCKFMIDPHCNTELVF